MTLKDLAGTHMAEFRDPLSGAIVQGSFTIDAKGKGNVYWNHYPSDPRPFTVDIAPDDRGNGRIGMNLHAGDNIGGSFYFTTNGTLWLFRSADSRYPNQLGSGTKLSDATA